MASLKSLTVAELRRELQRREKGSKKLLAQHSALAKRLAAIDAELADLGVEVPARRGRKPGRMPGRLGPGRPAGRRAGRASKGGMTLIEAIEKGVPTGRTVSPAEAAEAAKRAGYKTSSRSFGQQVAGALARATSFKKLGRGKFQRVGGSSSAKGKRGRRKPGRPKGSRNKSKAKSAATAKAEAPPA